MRLGLREGWGVACMCGGVKRLLDGAREMRTARYAPRNATKIGRQKSIQAREFRYFFGTKDRKRNESCIEEDRRARDESVRFQVLKKMPYPYAEEGPDLESNGDPAHQILRAFNVRQERSHNRVVFQR
jgi:hypothetical protein